MNSVVINYSEVYTTEIEMKYNEIYYHDVSNLYRAALYALVHSLHLEWSSPEVRSLLEASTRHSPDTIGLVIWDDVN